MSLFVASSNGIAGIICTSKLQVNTSSHLLGRPSFRCRMIDSEKSTGQWNCISFFHDNRFHHTAFQAVHACHLRSAISSEAERGYCDILGETMRFSSFLHVKLLKWCSQSNHMSTRKLLEEVRGYNTASISERSKILNKVSVLIGYRSIEDLIEIERLQKASDPDMNSTVVEFDLELARERFPCIKMGESSLIELYDEAVFQHERASLQHEGFKKFLPSYVDEKRSEADKLVEAWQILGPLSNINAPSSGGSHMLHDSQTVDSDDETNSNAELTSNISAAGINALETKVSEEQSLDRTVRSLPRITSRQCRQLEDSGFHTVRKLLHHFPRTYADLKNAQDAIHDGQYLIFVGTVVSSRGIRASSSFSFLEVVVGCEICRKEPTSEIKRDACDNEEKKVIYLHLKKFFRGRRFTSLPFLRRLQSKYEEGNHVYVSGKVKEMHKEDHYEMREYNIDKLEEEEEKHAQVERRPYPLYSSKMGLKPNFLRDMISRALTVIPADIDPLPNEILQEFNLLNICNLGRLYQMLESLGTVTEKKKLLYKFKNHVLNDAFVEEWSTLTKNFLKGLPYCLTPSQLNAVSEIILDLRRPIPMNRLLQGDVGCGKTVVAFLACMEVIGSGYQAAFMVPTELLAVQHYEHLLSLLENSKEDVCKPSVALLTGSTPSKQSRAILKGLQTGDITMVIGTHSLISERVEFSALRIAVVDEQHRFGVIQRGRFNSKLYSPSTSLRLSDGKLVESFEEKVYMAPHILALSATPIPRTLALALYGDMSLTQITDLPPGRTPVKTIVLEGNEIGFENVFQMMREELIGGGKVYLVYPVIQESENLPQLRAAAADFETFPKKFQGYQCGLLHGRMKIDEKDDTLRKFRSGETRILLATQVIEIGVDVPDASMMVVMNAERFGIAQLHQLRGRVGRGTRKSRCVFLSSTSTALNRLKVLEKSSDGFYLANADLLLRGPGNLLGKKQSGHLPEFPIARLEVDGNVLQEAHLAALKILGASDDLERFPKLKVELSMRQPLCILGD